MNQSSKTSQITKAAQQIVYDLRPQPLVRNDSINLLSYLDVLMRYKWLIIFLTAISAIGMTVKSMNMASIYRAEITLVATSKNKSSASVFMRQYRGLASLAGISIGNDKIEEAIVILKSRLFTNSFIKDENLMPILFGVWNGQNKIWQIESGKMLPTAWQTYRVFNAIRSIEQNKQNGTYTLAIEWKDPYFAMLWANKIVAYINEHQKTAAIDKAQKSINYLKSELKKTDNVGMRHSIFQLIEAQTISLMLANVSNEFVFKVIDPAVIPEDEIRPRKKRMIILGLIGGFVFGVLFSFLLSFYKKINTQ